MARSIVHVREAVLVRHDLVFHAAQRQDQGADHASPVLSGRAVEEDGRRVAAGGEVAQDILVRLIGLSVDEADLRISFWKACMKLCGLLAVTGHEDEACYRRSTSAIPQPCLK